MSHTFPVILIETCTYKNQGFDNITFSKFQNSPDFWSPKNLIKRLILPYTLETPLITDYTKKQNTCKQNTFLLLPLNAKCTKTIFRTLFGSHWIFTEIYFCKFSFGQGYYKEGRILRTKIYYLH